MRTSGCRITSIGSANVIIITANRWIRAESVVTGISRTGIIIVAIEKTMDTAGCIVAGIHRTAIAVITVHRSMGAKTSTCVTAIIRA
jgi:hypothetical protein